MYDAYARYALAWVPPWESPLARFGFNWTGWCAEHAHQMPQHPLEGIGSMLDGITEEICRTGLCAAIARPFSLDRRSDAWLLESAIEHIGTITAPIEVEALRPALVAGRVALVPARPCPALDKLAGRARAALSSFKSDPSQAFAEDPAAFIGALTPGQKPGAPSLSADRFHIPLTDEVSPFRAERLLRALPNVLSAAALGKIEICDLALMGDPGEGRPLVVLTRIGLNGTAGMPEPTTPPDPQPPFPEDYAIGQND